MPRLLIVKTSSLGDVIHNLPILADIRAHIPEMRFDWVVEEGFADIPALHPAVASVIPVAIRRWRRRLWAPATWREMAAARKRIRAQRYDFILDTQGLLKSAFIASQARGVLHGQDSASAREPLAARFYREQHAVPRGQHAVQRNRLLAALALGYAMPDSPPDYGIQSPALAPDIALPSPYVVGLHATSRDSKLWPVGHWTSLGQQLSAQGLHLLLPWGSEGEYQRALAIAVAVPQAVVLPRMRLAQLAAVLAGARAAVGVDTGLAHLAVALGVPTVAVYTDTDPALTGLLAGNPARARNLGGAGQCPPAESVLAALENFTA
ncbi:MAG TPA: lipopolysaccharide heptosyltransferase I [Methylophilaceae bacterium]|nr:lipopolysaccharide heptosyltransferase I [Methylophilaceae bacterium]